MIKYVRKPYEVLEGEVENKWYVAPPAPPESSFTPRIVDASAMGPMRVPTAKERYRLIREAQSHGIEIGSKVIRVNAISRTCIDNPRFIGTVTRFLFSMWPGSLTYRPLCVRFENQDGSFQEFPFHFAEIETVENARKQIELFTKTTTSMEERILEDIGKERNGVVPFRNPNPILFLPQKFSRDGD